MIFRKKNRGQTSLEYAILLIILMGAFLTVQMYVKRGVQGRWKESVDQLGEQYDPRRADTSIRQTITSSTNTAILATEGEEGYWTRRTDETSSTERKTGYTSIDAY